VIHNHGSEEGAGLSCNELRLPDGSRKGACLVDYCETDFVPGREQLHCVTHDEPATHVSPHDSAYLVCGKYADLLGCKCHKENYEKVERANINVGDVIVVGDKIYTLQLLGNGSTEMLVLVETNG
jgi:hypothetical protein